MNWVKENGGILVVLGVVVLLLGGYAEWRISVAVDAKFIEQGTVSPAKVDAIDTKIEAVKADVGVVRDQHNSDRDRMDGKIERIVDILLED